MSYGFGAFFGLLPGGDVSSIMLVYGFPISLLGFALAYAQLKPVPCKTTRAAFNLRDAQMTDIQKQVSLLLQSQAACTVCLKQALFLSGTRFLPVNLGSDLEILASLCILCMVSLYLLQSILEIWQPSACYAGSCSLCIYCITRTLSTQCNILQSNSACFMRCCCQESCSHTLSCHTAPVHRSCNFNYS